MGFCSYGQCSNLLYGCLKSQELQEKAHQLSQVKAELKETVDEMERLKKQLEVQNSTLENMEIENLKLTQQVYENLAEMRLVNKENDDLKVMEETLRVEQDQLRKSLQQMEANVSSHPTLVGFRITERGVSFVTTGMEKAVRYS